jgi:hypothetical protein
MLIGHARVSTEQQSGNLQLDAPKKAGCQRILTHSVAARKAGRHGSADALSHLLTQHIHIACGPRRAGLRAGQVPGSQPIGQARGRAGSGRAPSMPPVMPL